MPHVRYLTFIQTPSYARAAKRLFDDSVQRDIELRICDDPECGELESGVRKLRIGIGGRGRRGGARVVYYHLKPRGRVYLLEVFAKNEKIALTESEKNEIRLLTRMLERGL